MSGPPCTAREGCMLKPGHEGFCVTGVRDAAKKVVVEWMEALAAMARKAGK